jgi:DNA-binding response OmpR family regulator
MKKRRVLVIEDQEDLAALYEKALTGGGYEVLKAYTGEEGVAVFEDERPDIIVLDMTLPEMNGLQTLERVRTLDARVPVIIATGEDSEDKRRQCGRLGVQHYLSKPVSSDDLVSAIRESLADPKTTTEEYEVITLRLPRRIIRCLSGLDENLERAVEMICEEKFSHQATD